MVLLTALALAAAVLAWPGTQLLVRNRSRVPRAPRPTRADPTAVLLQVIEAVAAQVRGGAIPTVAWDAAVDLLGPPAAHLPRSRGGHLADGLRRVAGGDRVLASVAAAWALADDVGAPLAEVLEQLAASLRHEADADAEIAASLAAPRATARLLAVLPVAGVGLGQLIGAGPLHVLVGTSLGRLSGLCGLALALGGHLWTRRLVARAAATT